MDRLVLLTILKSLRVILDDEDTKKANAKAAEVLDCVLIEAYEKHDSNGNVK